MGLLGVASMKVFLSYAFRADDSDLAQGVERLLSSHDIIPATGRRLGGEQLNPEVQRLIEDSDGLIALMTRRERLGGVGADRWVTHPWIRDEYGHARANGKRTIALVENGVDIEGAYASYERIPLDRGSPLEAFLALTETLQRWKTQIGVRRIAQIRPDSIGTQFLTSNELRCRYRVIQEGVYGSWVEQEPVVAASGTLLYLRGVQDEDALVQVEILRSGQPQWWSQATAQFISVEMLAPEEQP
jgi:hypothetical protein